METEVITKSDIERIANAITQAGLLQGHVAKQIGCSQVHLSYILNGHVTLTDDMRAKLFQYLKIKV